ncbi:peptidase S8/S53 domain-containing protein [Naematelia encephala]|uniref:Peptidase S8/S53 domain-containing protein n=1 Tax=Naematelia encephala TaxID=71784 RepID=A0A1Y2AFP5_9TREE|nr:peptidase S8/S53 domain-containing protein [Naematelia encephala]
MWPPSRFVPLLLPLLLVATNTQADLSPRRPQPRSYDTHSYYSLELAPSSSPAHALSVAQALGVELVEPLGELAGHWIVRVEGSTPHHLAARSAVTATTSTDPVLQRWKRLRSASKRDGSSKHLRALNPLTVRQRVKRSSPHRSPIQRSTISSHQLFGREDDSELLFAQNDLHLADPMLNQQWHLINTDMPEIELNVTGLWSRGVTGNDVHVVIVDDGLDLNSQDLHDNFFAEGSYDFNDHTELPLPRLSDDQHGTRCAGEIAAVPNDVCGVGVSYTAKIAGVRILSGPISDADEAAALNYAYQLNDIYSCSWGPPDDGKSMEAPDGVILKAMVNGVQNGRDGKGSIFVFAAGNGGGVDDQCNFDGYTNSIFSVTIGAVDRKGLHPYYSELCAAMMVVAPSSGSGDHIHTTDIGENKCAHTHGGTSAAAPLAVGVFALALSVRPDLTWRDFQHLSVRTAVFFNPDDPDWEKTAAGRMFSYKYGYGRLDAGLFVEAAESWDLVKPQAWFDSPAVYLPTTTTADSAGRRRIKRQDEETDEPSNDDDTSGGEDESGEPSNPEPVVQPSGSLITEEGVTSTFEVTQGMLDDSNLERLEHVTVRVWIEHQRRGDVEVEVTSPNGVTSVLARKRRFDDADTGFPGWKFMSLKHWDENPVGTWTILVKDQSNPEKTGRFIAWALQLWGGCVDASLAKVWAPAEEGEPDEEETGSDPTAVVSQKPKPTEHLPGDHGEAEGEAHEPGLGGGTTAAPEPTGGSDDDTDIAEPGDDDQEDLDGGFFSGISNLAGSSTWLAGAGLIVVIFGASVGAFFFFRARRKRRNLFGLANNGEGARGQYAPVSEDVPMGLLERGRRKLGRGGGAMGGGQSKELYDAFGDGPSDEDESDDDGGRVSERTGLRYHDDFLDDEEGEGHDGPPAYRDEPAETEGAKAGESASGSSSSWQDAAEDVSKP